MTALISTFASSLLLLSLFFAFKEWEIKRGSATSLTRFFHARSPMVQGVCARITNRVVRFVRVIVQAGWELIRYGLYKVLVWCRTAIVLVAAHMIRAARGEKLVAQGKVSSDYFKHLYEHKKRIQRKQIGVSEENIVR